MSEHEQQSQQDPRDDERDERPQPDQHDPGTEEDTASGGPAQEPDHSR